MYKYTSELLRKASSIGIAGDIEEVASYLTTAVKSSAICTHELGSRRYFDYILDFEEDELIDINEMNPSSLTKYVECLDCEDRGFHMQGGVKVPCQNCSNKY